MKAVGKHSRTETRTETRPGKIEKKRSPSLQPLSKRRKLSQDHKQQDPKEQEHKKEGYQRELCSVFFQDLPRGPLAHVLSFIPSHEFFDWVLHHPTEVWFTRIRQLLSHDPLPWNGILTFPKETVTYEMLSEAVPWLCRRDPRMLGHFTTLVYPSHTTDCWKTFGMEYLMTSLRSLQDLP